MKAIHIKPGRIIEYAGELHDTGDTKREVEILQFDYSFIGGAKAFCKVGNLFEVISVRELEVVESI